MMQDPSAGGWMKGLVALEGQVVEEGYQGGDFF